MLKSVKTFILLAAMSGLLLAIGAWIDAGQGTGTTFFVIAFAIAMLMNVVAYFFSDRLAIRAARAEPMDPSRYRDVHELVRDLAARAGRPMPRLYLSPSPQLNAFATGRNPKNAAVCINQGLYEALDREELEGVLAHELQHVYNRDILVGTVAAVLATMIVFISRMAFWFGGRNRGGNPIAGLLMVILAPLAAMLIQAAITRSRESLADRSGAQLTGKPIALARALAKLEQGARSPALAQRGGTPAETNPAYAHLFIHAPFGGRAMLKMFATHPPIPERIAALEDMARKLGQLGPDPRTGR